MDQGYASVHQKLSQFLSVLLAVREEFVDFVLKKFWAVLPAKMVLGLADLRLSPLGVVPQHER